MRPIKDWSIYAKYALIGNIQFIWMLKKYLVRGADVAFFLKAENGSPEEVWKILDVVDTDLVLVASCQVPESFEERITFVFFNDAWHVDNIDEKYTAIKLCAIDEENGALAILF